MKILYIHQYFKTPNDPGGTRSYWFSRKLIENKYEVVMITSRNSQKKFIEEEQIDGIRVIYIKNQYDNSMSLVNRALSFIKFMLVSTSVAMTVRNVKLVYATSTPLTVGIPALILKWLKRKDYIFEVRDLWPEVPIQMGGLKNQLLINVVKGLERLIYKYASHIVALSPGMLDGVVSCDIPKSKVSMIPNMSKIDRFYPREKNREIANRFNIDTYKYNLIHFGAMGEANGLDYIVEAADYASKNGTDNLNFIFAGGGSTEVRLKEKVKELQLNNVSFLGKHPMNVISELVNIADVSMVSFADIEILRTNSPNKLFDSLSAGKPVIVNSAGWTKEMVEENNCGIFVDPQKPEELIEILTCLSNNESMCLEMGKNARILAETKYDKIILCNEFFNMIKTYAI